MKKLIVLAAFAAILFVSCDDTRKALHENYLEFVMHTDSLEVVHEAMTVSHEQLKTDTRTLSDKLKEVEETDSIAMADLQKHQMLLKQQAETLSKLKSTIESHSELKAYFMSDSITVTQMEQQLTDMEANNEEIAARLNQIKTELKTIEAEQEALKQTSDK
ncbi:hypothetical protein ACFSYG_07335 [Leeuwenhoekiella polynyae]|uniref:Lipoprotein n=1 Tax=Leeuwenhoekiella polynyae TaxID=1550906 RepID=A0A4Q0P0C3_9FLAO|nr:hypothetical protein [Leeuwenhoekiella polynyae]RXG17062.1 hypothetical protein DSM02_3160 [Leeuwenhoekiella polynyae]|tara:strand:- start:401 stop:883 length:483 start_codon:yes stop_codon:yes gene_type:complete